MNLTTISCIVGTILLLTLCYVDFKSNVIKPRFRLSYYISLFLLFFANLVIYNILLSFIAGIEYSFITFTYNFKGDNPDLFKYRDISPIVIAILYFGTGAATFKYKDEEISFYEKLLKVFQRMFPRSFYASERIKSHLEKLGEETEMLADKIQDLHVLAGERGWNVETEKWERIDNGRKSIENDIAVFSNIEQELSQNLLTEVTMNNLADKIKSHIKKLRTEINNTLRVYMREMLALNIKDERAIDHIAEILGMPSDDVIEVQPPLNMARVIGNTMLFGIILGLIYEVLGSEYPSNLRIFYLCVGFLPFNFIFSYISRAKKTFDGFCRSLIYGSLAGFAGHFVFILITKYSLVFDTNGAFSLNWKLFYDITQGTVIGLFCAMTLHVYRYYIATFFRNTIIKYVAGGILSGLVIWLVLLVYHSTYTCSAINYLKEYHLRYILLGVVIGLNVSFVSSILEEAPSEE